MPFHLLQEDITKMKTDAIVNAANTQLKQGGGVCGAIFAAAGAVKLKEACDFLAPVETGEAVITPAFDLPSKYIIHTVGPVYAEYCQAESERLLHSAYTNSLQLALNHQCKSIAFPLISSGIYGYPKADALKIARDAIVYFLTNNEMDVTLLVFDNEVFNLAQEYLIDKM